MPSRSVKTYTWVEENHRHHFLSLGSGFTIDVTRHIDQPNDVWVMHCYELGVSRKPLKNKDLDAAKKEAIETIRARLTKCLELLG